MTRLNPKKPAMAISNDRAIWVDCTVGAGTFGSKGGARLRRFRSHSVTSVRPVNGSSAHFLVPGEHESSTLRDRYIGELPTMQAYESVPCPHCGATWNRPDSQVCQACSGALTIPRARVGASSKLPLIALGGLILAAVVAGLLVIPLLAANQLSTNRQAVGAALSHQAAVDEAMKVFLTPYDSKTGHGGISETNLHLDQYRSALQLIRADNQRIQESDHQLEWMGNVAVTKKPEIEAARRQNRVLLDAFRQADGALSAATDQATVVQSLTDMYPLTANLVKASNNKDYAGAEAYVAQVDAKLVPTEALVLKPDMPNGAGSLIRTYRLLLNDTDRFIAAARNQDGAGAHSAYQDLVTDRKTAQQFNADFTAKWDAWNVKNLVPIVATYDADIARARATN